MILQIIALYFFLGLVFSIAFVAKGCSAIDPAAAKAGAGVRLLWVPAAILLWPLLLMKWLAAREG
ncbi:MAG: hypothetical protein KTR17_10300 [Cellvibrionaceae bacterium]|nr:hypothetical protein [Cellvibrionaceae bacterium]